MGRQCLHKPSGNRRLCRRRDRAANTVMLVMLLVLLVLLVMLVPVGSFRPLCVQHRCG